MIVLVFLCFQAVLATCIAYLLSLAHGGLNAGIALFSLAAGAVFAATPARMFRHLPRWPATAFEAALCSGLLGYLVWQFSGLILTTSPTGIGTRAVNNYGDLALHIAYIRSMLDGTTFPPLNPGYPSEVLRYPIGADFHNALWEQLGIATQLHFAVTGILAAALILGLLLRLGGWWVVGGYFLNTGWLFISDLLGPMSLDDVNFQDSTAFKNLTFANLIPQRSMLFALPMGLMLILAWQAHAKGERRLTRAQMLVLGAVWGVLPLFHLHAFVAVSLILALIAVAWGGLRGLRDLMLSPMAAVAYLPATLLLLHSTDWLHKAGIAHLKPGWTAGETFFPLYLWQNFGLWLALPLGIAAVLWQGRAAQDRDSRAMRRMAAGTLGLFALFFTVMLAPWDWDNIKLILWPWLLLLALSQQLLGPRLAQAGQTLRAAVPALLLAPGALYLAVSAQVSPQDGYIFMSKDEVAGTTEAVADLPRTAVFLASRRANHPLDWLGRFRVLGYEGHLWSHGIDSRGRNAALKQIVDGTPDWRSAAYALGIDYILWTPVEVADYGPEPRPWMTELQNISTVPGFAVYAVPR